MQKNVNFIRLNAKIEKSIRKYEDTLFLNTVKIIYSM